MTTEPGSIEPSGWGPMGETQVLAAMLGTDRADVASYTRVLTSALAAALPPGMIEVTRRRGWAPGLPGARASRWSWSCTARATIWPCGPTDTAG